MVVIIIILVICDSVVSFQRRQTHVNITVTNSNVHHDHDYSAELTNLFNFGNITVKDQLHDDDIFSFMTPPVATSYVSHSQNENHLKPCAPFTHFKTKTVQNAHEAALFQDLEQFIAKMNNVEFEDHPLFYKSLNNDTNGWIFQPWFESTESGIMYQADQLYSSQADQDVFIVDDGIPHTFAQRRYVALRKLNGSTSQQFYTATVLYLMSPNPDGFNTVTLGGKRFHLEFDVWSSGVENNLAAVGWLHCDSSIYSYCVDEEQAHTLYLPTDPIKHHKPLATHEYVPRIMNCIQSSISDCVKTCEVDDIFQDLDTKVTNARWISHVVDTLTPYVGKLSQSERMYLRRSLLYDVTQIDTLGPLQYTPESIFSSSNIFEGHHKHLEVSRNPMQDNPDYGPLTPTNLNVMHRKTWRFVTNHGLEQIMGVIHPIQVPIGESAEIEIGQVLQEQSPPLGGLGGLVHKPRITLQFASRETISSEPIGDHDFNLYKTLLTRTDLFINPGWKTLGLASVLPNSTMATEFYGFGPCQNHLLSDNNLKLGYDHSSLVAEYLKVLRIHCLDDKVHQINQLFTDGYLYVTKRGHIALLINKDIYKTPTAQLKKLYKVALAVDFISFVQAYHADAAYPQTVRGYRSPDKVPISRNVYVIGKALVKQIILWNVKLRTRRVLLSRHAVISLRTVFTRLLQDYIMVRYCPVCALDLQLLENDLIFIKGLIHFVLRDLTPSRPSTILVNLALTKFFQKNRQMLKNRLNWYISLARQQINQN